MTRQDETNIETMPATEAAPTIAVRVQPVSSAIGKTNTAMVSVAAALRKNIVRPETPTITHP